MIRRPFNCRDTIVSVGALAIALWPPPAAAQASSPPAGEPAPSPPSSDQTTPEANDDRLGDIVVTAQKRSENLQRVPIAITALNSDTLSKLGVTNVGQISSYSPNVDIKNTISFAGSSQILVATIRGIGQNDFAFNLEPGVGVYVDGVYYARSLGAIVDLLDLERVEVLKGPQGTLFGRNTIGGALSIITRDPSRDLHFQIEGTTGSYRRTDLRASLDLPLVDDTLLSQFSVSYKHREGYQRRIPFPGLLGTVSDLGSFRLVGAPGGSQRQGGEDAFNARAKLLWEPSDAFRVILAGDYTHADQEARPSTVIKTAGGATDGTLGALYNGCIFAHAPPFLCSTRGYLNTSYYGVNADADPNNNRIPLTDAVITGDIDTSYSRGSNFDRLTSWGVGATATWNIDNNFALKSITAYRSLHSTFGNEIGATPFVTNEATFAIKQRQFSQELQLTFNALDDRLKSVVGGYFFTESGSELDALSFQEGLLQIYSPNTFRNRAYALFAHEHFDITSRLGLTFGVRYTKENKRFEGGQRDLNSFFIRSRGVDPNGPLPPFILAILPDPNDRTRIYPLGVSHLSFNNTSFRAGLEYRLTDKILAYYSFSQGFKSGGWTIRLIDVIPSNNASDLTFKPEKANTHEVGLKTTLLEDHVRLNAAAFTTDYSDLQVTIQNGISPVFSNAGQARIRGFEVEGQARVGDLSLNASVGYLDAKYTSIAPGATISVNDALVNAPKWSASVGAVYDIRLQNGGRFSLASDYSYKSNTHPDAENSPFLQSGNIGLLNGSVSYESPRGAWEVSAGVRNITDKRFVVGGFDQSHPGQNGFTSVSYSPPREWYLTLRFKY